MAQAGAQGREHAYAKQVATPVTEPAGRADNGHAFEQ
jgi:hypothetical protein